ncbi:hypothetical protein ABIC27_000256 [Streptomyces sp. PvR034]
MQTTVQATIRDVLRALDTDDYPTALRIAQAAYRTATDDATRTELLLTLGPRAANSPDDQWSIRREGQPWRTSSD